MDARAELHDRVLVRVNSIYLNQKNTDALGKRIAMRVQLSCAEWKMLRLQYYICNEAERRKRISHTEAHSICLYVLCTLLWSFVFNYEPNWLGRLRDCDALDDIERCNTAFVPQLDGSVIYILRYSPYNILVNRRHNGSIGMRSISNMHEVPKVSGLYYRQKTCDEFSEYFV